MSLGHFTKLPAELLVQISDRLPFEDRLTLASVHGQLRAFLIPGLFATVRVTNLEKDEEAIAGVVEKYGRHVQKLYFQVHLVQEPEDDDSLYDVGNESGDEQPEPESEGKSKGTVVPDSVVRLLSGEALPKVASVVLEFCPEDNFEGENWGDEEGLGCIYIHAEAEDLDQARSIEHNLRWRAALSRVWRGLYLNQAVTSLAVIKLIPVAQSAWSDWQWAAFLGRLRGELSLDIYGTDNGAGWHSNTADGYIHFLEHLDEYFLSHTMGVTRLALLFHEDSPCGCEGFMRHAPLPLLPERLWYLQRLELRNAFIDPRLVEFMKCHTQVLSSFILEECFAASPNALATNSISWAELFNGISSKPTALCELVVKNKKVPLTRDEEFAVLDDEDDEKPDSGKEETADYLPPDDEDEEVKTVRRELKQNAGAKLFAYATLDDKYGMVFKDEDMNLQAYKDGADQAAYAKMLDRVNANAEARCKESVK